MLKPLQAIEFKTTLKNGIVTIPAEYSVQWEGKMIRVIVLDDTEKIFSAEVAETNPLKGSVIFEGDLISPIAENWEAEQ